jgi:hypothetical protein
MSIARGIVSTASEIVAACVEGIGYSFLVCKDVTSQFEKLKGVIGIYIYIYKTTVIILVFDT